MTAGVPSDGPTDTTRRLAPPRSLDVLVVDDEVGSRRAIDRAVRFLGHRTRLAENGEQALALLTERRPEVVIADWEMPGMSGTELCTLSRQLRRESEDGPYTYFILLTGHDDHEHMMKGMEAGADDFQRKPFDLAELEARLLAAARVIAHHEEVGIEAAKLRSESRRHYVDAHTDALTGARNRRALDDDLAQLFARATRYDHRYAIGICDVDNFKAFNDALGHVAGDHALCQVADVLRATVRASDAVYRFGGEEFVVLFPEQTLEQATLAMDRVRAAVERLAIPAPNGVLTVSAGVAEVAPERDRGPAEWLARADAALYGAKADGRNRVEAMPAEV